MWGGLTARKALLHLLYNTWKSKWGWCWWWFEQELLKEAKKEELQLAAKRDAMTRGAYRVKNQLKTGKVTDSWEKKRKKKEETRRRRKKKKGSLDRSQIGRRDTHEKQKKKQRGRGVSVSFFVEWQQCFVDWFYIFFFFFFFLNSIQSQIYIINIFI